MRTTVPSVLALVLLWLLSVAPPGILAATTRYVSTCGSDTNDGLGRECNTGASRPLRSLQTAINASVDGDTILVSPGTYAERIDLGGKAITLSARNLQPLTRPVIDGGGSGVVVTCASGETSRTMIRGFEIVNGTTGIRVQNAAPVLLDCVVTGCSWSGLYITGGVIGGALLNDQYAEIRKCDFIENSAVEGGGILIRHSAPQIIECSFRDNSAEFGGGIACFTNSGNGRWPDPMVRNCVFSGNQARLGGGMYVGQGGSIRVSACTLARNIATMRGGGVDVPHQSYPPSLFTSCILWQNAAPEGQQIGGSVSPSAIQVTSSCVQGGFPGPGNISADPLFRNAHAGDFNLLGSSSCIDRGEVGPAVFVRTWDSRRTPYYLVDGDGDGFAVLDIGAFEYAGPPVPQPVPCRADFNGNDTADLPDLFAFLSEWLAGCP